MYQSGILKGLISPFITIILISEQCKIFVYILWSKMHVWPYVRYYLCYWTIVVAKIYVRIVYIYDW